MTPKEMYIIASNVRKSQMRHHLVLVSIKRTASILKELPYLSNEAWYLAN